MKRAEIRKLINWAKIHKKYSLLRKIWLFNQKLFKRNTDLLLWKDVLIHPDNYVYTKNKKIYQIDYILNNE